MRCCTLDTADDRSMQPNQRIVCFLESQGEKRVSPASQKLRDFRPVHCLADISSSASQAGCEVNHKLAKNQHWTHQKKTAAPGVSVTRRCLSQRRTEQTQLPSHMLKYLLVAAALLAG